MHRIVLLTVTLAVAIGMFPTHSLAQSRPLRGPVEMRTDKTLDEISDYVAAVDRRLQRGRYDRIDAKERVWMIRQIAELRTELEGAGSGSRLSSTLQVMAGEFELGVIRIEEGGIICRNERRTGTHRTEDRCYSQKRIREDEEHSRDTLRQWRRPQAISGGGGGNS